MKKTLLAVTIAAGIVPATAFAQSSNVTLYGTVDAGVGCQNHVDSGTNGNDSVTAPTSGELSGSHWGIRGTEGLGNNLEDIFVLESGFDINASKFAQDNWLFGRQAYVGLQGDFSAITSERQQNTLYDLFAVYNPIVVGPNYSLNSAGNQFNGRADNAIKYTGKFGGLTAMGFYSFGRGSNSGLGGEVPGSFKIGKGYSAGIVYANDPLSVGVAYDQYQGSTIATSILDTKCAAIGASYAVGDAKVFTGYRWLHDEVTTGGARYNSLYQLDALCKLTPTFALTGVAYCTNACTGSNNPWMLVLNADYALSRRTDAYTLIGCVNSKGNTTYGVTGTTSTLPGQNQTGTMVDMRHCL